MTNTLLTALVFTIPSIALFGIAYYFIKNWSQQQNNQWFVKQKQSMIEQSMPLKFQAYERLTMMMERIRLEGLVRRINPNELSVQEYRKLLSLTINQEFEHNLSQQIYMSESLWMIIRTAKEQIDQILVTALRQPNRADSVEQYLKNIAELIPDKQPSDVALNAIREEFNTYFVR